MNATDQLIARVDKALRTVSGVARASRPNPAGAAPDTLEPQDRPAAGALMRVNHVGEVCAQALYQAQALTARTPELRQHMDQAALEEGDHLAWTQERLTEMGDRVSLLNPLWYAGAFGIGLLAGRLGDRASLGFLVETERQVEEHLAGHLQRLPEADTRSRVIVQAMQDDERRHADQALAAGGAPLPTPVRWLMRGAAKLMTTAAARI